MTSPSDTAMDEAKAMIKTLAEAVDVLMETTRHAYQCPEKEGRICTCGFHEALTKGAKALSQARAFLEGEKG